MIKKTKCGMEQQNTITIEFAQRMYKHGIALTIRNKRVIATLNR